MKELYSESFDYTDGVGNSGRYTYRVPQLLAETEGAAAINRTIDETYGTIVREAQESVRMDGNGVNITEQSVELAASACRACTSRGRRISAATCCL